MMMVMMVVEMMTHCPRHYIHEKKKERRPSIVSRNFRKMFGK